MIPLMNLGMVALMWLVGVMLVKAKLQIDPERPALSFAQHRVYRRRLGHGLGICSFGMAVMFMLIGFATIWHEHQYLIWIAVALGLFAAVPIIVASVISGQGGCRIKIKDVGEEPLNATDGVQKNPLVEGRGDDKYWALGMFYYNPDDPAMFVEDRFGTNFGFNYARASIKIGVAILLVGIIALYAWITVFAINLM
jgi:uncharacterized membrane protein